MYPMFQFDVDGNNGVVHYISILICNFNLSMVYQFFKPECTRTILSLPIIE